MQESFSITETRDSASHNTAVMWAIMFVITNIHECVKSMKRKLKYETAWVKRKSIKGGSGLIKQTTTDFFQNQHKKEDSTLTCGKSSPQWSLQSAICRPSLAASGRSSMLALLPVSAMNAKNDEVTLTETQASRLLRLKLNKEKVRKSKRYYCRSF